MSANSHALATGGLLDRYRSAVQSGRLLPDDQQAECALRLSVLADQLLEYTDSLTAYRKELEAYQVLYDSFPPHSHL